MDLAELRLQEQVIILITRNFRFLFEECGYIDNSFYIGVGETSVSYTNNSIKRQVRIIWEYMGYFYVGVHKIRWQNIFGRKDPKFYAMYTYDLYDEFKYQNLHEILNESNMQELITRHAQFIKDYLMPVIKGEMWFDELIKEHRAGLNR